MLVLKLMHQTGFCGFHEGEIQERKKNVKECRGLVINTLKDHCSFALYTFKNHPIDLIVGSLKGFGSLKMLEASLLNTYNVHIRILYHRTSKK